MRVRRSVAAAAAVAVTGAQAQSAAAYPASTTTIASTSSAPAAVPYGTTSSSSSVPASVTPSASVSYMTVTYDDCPSQSMESMITVTNGITVTYCPECEMMGSTTKPFHPGYTTVYTTTYLSLCPTGIVPATYTVTESCTDATPTWTPGPSHIPDGFTVTTKQCTVCDSTPTAVTITEPCGCHATNGIPVTNPPAATTPAATCNGNDCGGSGNQSPKTTPGGSGSSPSSACNGNDCGGSGNQNTSPAPAGSNGGAPPPYPTATATMTTANCPGPQCRAAASSYPSGVNYGNTSGIVPSAGAASSLSVLSSLLVAAIGVAGLAFAL